MTVPATTEENTEVFAPATESDAPVTKTQSTEASELISTEDSPAPHIVLAPEIIGHIGPLPVTNTLMVSWLVMAIIIVLSLLATRKMAMVPVSKLQNLLELIIDAGYKLTKDMAHDKAKVFFPIVMTFFLFIFVANIVGLFPGFATIGLNQVHDGNEVFVPLLRSINSDLNMTLALALISAALTHYFAVKYLGLKDYLKKWFSLNPIFLFVGLLELVSEVTKVISLSFRLFGNIFAGEVVLATISSLFAFVVPLPFYFLELIVAFVQAAVFMMLTLVFMTLLSEKHEAH